MYVFNLRFVVAYSLLLKLSLILHLNILQWSPVKEFFLMIIIVRSIALYVKVLLTNNNQLHTADLLCSTYFI